MNDTEQTDISNWCMYLDSLYRTILVDKINELEKRNLKLENENKKKKRKYHDMEKKYESMKKKINIYMN